MTFNDNSKWSLENELRCFVIFKTLESHNLVPRGLQSELCRDLESRTNLSFNTIYAKVGNYKSVSGLIGNSHFSSATKFVMERYGRLSLAEAKALLNGYLLCLEQHA
ncbi:hypothetical protein [Photobacterium kishitanii]|nr:hypothetical protein [Photobacterium kishitanii]